MALPRIGAFSAKLTGRGLHKGDVIDPAEPHVLVEPDSSMGAYV